MNRRGLVSLALALALSLAVVGCGGGGSSGGEAEDDISDLVLIDVNVGGTDGVALNQVIAFLFSEEVVASSVTPETMRIRLSPANAKQVPGDFNISGNVVEFFPRLPVMADLSDAGLVPGATYEAKLPGYPKTNTLENADGDPLAKTYKVSFATAVANSPDVFIDYMPEADPQVISVNPRDEAMNVPADIQVELTFNKPLHPATVTTSNITMTMTHRPPGTLLDPARPIQCSLILEQNRQSTVISVDPIFPLADNATYAIKVERRVSDLVGTDLLEHNSTFTLRDEPPVPGQFVLGFGDGTEVYRNEDETIASWNEDVPGALSGIFTAGAGDGSDGDFDPSYNTTLNSNIQSEYNFRTFKLSAGQTLRLLGDEPMTIRSLGSMDIQGVIDASGEDGDQGEVSTTDWDVKKSNGRFPLGGEGGPGGGDGGDIATNVTSSYTSTSPYYSGNQGKDGNDGWNAPGTGGGAAGWGSGYLYKYANGAGGGGGHRTAGKAGQKGQYSYALYNGTGGSAGGTGGNANLDPITAGGGGGPGQNVYYYSYPRNTGAGAGGGGGGALTLISANNIVITGGKIISNGGDGGKTGGSNAYHAGSGGAGAGGALLLRCLRNITATNAEITAIGGKGAPSGYTYYDGAGGDGGDGWIKLDDGDASPSLTLTKVDPSFPTTSTFVATGAGAPSVGETLWLNMGVFDPVFLGFDSDDVTEVIPKAGQSISYEIKATIEDIFDLGQPDDDAASAWVPFSQVATLNGHGYSYIKLRVTFTLAPDQTLDDPVPFVDNIVVRYMY